MELTEKKILVERNEVSYIDEGTGKLTIVFIHGFPFDKWMWANQLRTFRNEYRVIAYDVRGHGKTPANATEFSIPQFTNDLFAFLDHLKIDKVIICGLSMGGYIALHAIEQHSDRIEGLILADTQCAADTDEARAKRMKTIDSIKENGLLGYSNESVKNLFSAASLEKETESVGLIKKTILNTKAENICKTLMALANRKEKCGIIENVKTHALILVGAEDKITPLAAATKMHNLISNSTLHLIPEAGHVSNLENPDDFNNHVKTFLHSIPANK